MIVQKQEGYVLSSEAAGPTPQEVLNQADPQSILESNTLHPLFQEKVKDLLLIAQKNGLDVMLFEGFRSRQRQQELLSLSKKVTQAGPGRSFHNYGLAVDLVFRNQRGQPSWSPHHDWNKLGQIGKELGLTWGGDFRSLKDYGHFEYHPKLGIQEVVDLYEKGGIFEVWKKVS